jgi:predicted nucleic acid-binding protein
MSGWRERHILTVRTRSSRGTSKLSRIVERSGGIWRGSATRDHRRARYFASFAFRSGPLLAPYRPHLRGVDYVVSFQTVAEMRFGALVGRWSAQRRAVLEQFIAGLPIVGYSDSLATHWAELMSISRRAGRRMECGDAWIAATALLLAAPLLTHDRDFDSTACPSVNVIRYA